MRQGEVQGLLRRARRGRDGTGAWSTPRGLNLSRAEHDRSVDDYLEEQRLVDSYLGAGGSMGLPSGVGIGSFITQFIRRRRDEALRKWVDEGVATLRSGRTYPIVRLTEHGIEWVGEPEPGEEDCMEPFRGDTCFEAAVATAIQVPIQRVPDLRLDQRVADGDSYDEINRTSWEVIETWLADEGLTLRFHDRVPVALLRWVGVGCLAGDEQFSDPRPSRSSVTTASSCPTTGCTSILRSASSRRRGTKPGSGARTKSATGSAFTTTRRNRCRTAHTPINSRCEGAPRRRRDYPVCVRRACLLESHFTRVDDGADEDMPDLRTPVQREGAEGEPTPRSRSRLFRRQRNS